MDLNVMEMYSHIEKINGYTFFTLYSILTSVLFRILKKKYVVNFHVECGSVFYPDSNLRILKSNFNDAFHHKYFSRGKFMQLLEFLVLNIPNL